MDARQLPLAQPTQPERADATRNRALLLSTARALLEQNGVDNLTMDGLARAAGLGKGTVFRRFGSRTGLLLELINEIETEFQRRFLSGPPPLGPGAAPIERLVAFGRERIAILAVQGDLLRAADEGPDARFVSPPRAAGQLHISILLRQAGFDGDVDVQSFNLIATLDAALVLYENRGEQIEMRRVADGWEDLVRRVARPRS
ncbi:TetR/AcrR family transcriptional regulator [Subtercola lobariae]|uniref:Transcriptional regulator, TetR family protein n=1 Tax=Subtercola lobariae TaxID=1588641 RepID=A0A917BCG8_9MICO|nr:TetR/AcrR family transcriptional regulator [Subtercola lobariae]GGF37354.1 putative transcriptional regulator, TetR family protein [Subtercola lobariae]